MLYPVRWSTVRSMSLVLSKGLVFQPTSSVCAPGHAQPVPLNNWHLYEVLTTNMSSNSAVTGPSSFIRGSAGFSRSHGPHTLKQIQLNNYYYLYFQMNFSTDWSDFLCTCPAITASLRNIEIWGKNAVKTFWKQKSDHASLIFFMRSHIPSEITYKRCV